MSTHKFNDYDDDLITRLVRTLHSCQAVLRSSQHALRIFPVIQENNDTSHQLEETDVIQCNNLLKKISCQLQLAVPQFVFPIPKRPLSLESAISKFCGFELKEWRHIANLSLFDSLANKLSSVQFETGAVRQRVKSVGGSNFDVYYQGIPANEAVILIPPCGVPTRLFQPWLDILGAQHYTLTMENPFLFGDPYSLPEPSGDIWQEVDYIGIILEENNIYRAHLVGICGGAPIALAAAARFGQQIASLIVCHGDLNFGLNTPRSPFQNQFQGLLSDAATNISRAKEIYALFLDPAVLFGLPSQLGPFVLYPYSDFRLFQRYSKINSGLMAFDATQSAQQINQPVMIITSRDDRMTHPRASHLLHQIIGSSFLWERESGSHHDTLLGNQEIFTAISQFLNKDHSKGVID
jgi:pimeloyl-ACP methyl ester carboxylesterase